MAKLNIVLYEPEIPANTGNIGRTCVATGTRLHLIEPLGFHLDEKSIKRAGMDYWSELDVTTYVNWDDFCEKNPGAKIYMATTKGRHVYTEVSYEPDCYIMFGKESAGIPEEILKANPDTCVRIPMIGETRSLNLSNSVVIEAPASRCTYLLPPCAPEVSSVTVLVVSHPVSPSSKLKFAFSIPETVSADTFTGSVQKAV